MPELLDDIARLTGEPVKRSSVRYVLQNGKEARAGMFEQLTGPGLQTYRLRTN